MEGYYGQRYTQTYERRSRTLDEKLTSDAGLASAIGDGRSPVAEPMDAMTKKYRT